MSTTPGLSDELPSGPVAPSRRALVRRAPARARYDRETVLQVLDEGFVAHVAFSVEGQPFVIPMVYGRLGDHLYLHGSSASRLLRHLRDGAELSLAVTHLDGLVIARSAFHHSVNYRSVVVFGRAVEVTDAGEKLEALRAIVEHAVPDRWSGVRGPDSSEFHRTLVLRLPLDEASAKVRTGPPIDDEADLALDAWAGVIPIRLHFGEPRPDPGLRAGIEPTAEIRDYRRPGSSPGVSAASS